MNGFHITAVLSVLAVTYVSTGEARIIHVPGDSATIRSGLRGAANGDTVLVAPGVYYENIVWPGVNGIKLFSEAGAESTVIDGLNITQVLWLGSDQDTSTCIEGFTIQNGYNPNYAGGIQCWNSSPTIRNNIIANNFGGRGGGITCFGSSAVIDSNTIDSNFATSWGGGVLCYGFSLSLVISNNTIMNNSGSRGGGVACVWSSAIIDGNRMSRNWAQYQGGAIYCDSAQATIRCNKIIENSAGWYGGGIYSESYSVLTINHNDIFGNTNYGICNQDASITIDATYNWWGHETGPYDPSPGPPDYNPGGQGDTVSDYIAYRPWLPAPGVEEEVGVPRDSGYYPCLLQNYPNPFSGSTTILYTVPGSRVEEQGRGDSSTYQHTKLSVYDLSGRLVRTLVDEEKEPSIYRAKWDGKAENGVDVPVGPHFCCLVAGDFTVTRKMVVLR